MSFGFRLASSSVVDDRRDSSLSRDPGDNLRLVASEVEHTSQPIRGLLPYGGRDGPFPLQESEDGNRDMLLMLCAHLHNNRLENASITGAQEEGDWLLAAPLDQEIGREVSQARGNWSTLTDYGAITNLLAQHPFDVMSESACDTIFGQKQEITHTQEKRHEAHCRRGKILLFDFRKAKLAFVQV
ncbi:MAG TPA: hypothetical protein VE891_02395 [Allosphingosinicella sp.]|nr:hypothetical protein [Allosphingosinicella sp.]